MFKTRVLTGAALTVVLGLVVCFSHIPAVLDILVAFLCVKGICELYKAAGLYKNKPVTVISCLLAIVFTFQTDKINIYVAAAFFIAALILFSVLMAKVKTKTNAEPVLAVSIAVIITVFFNLLKSIRGLEKGVYLLGAALLISVLTDIFAYLCGKAFGKHKLAPVLSPNKTIEGSIGGTLCASAILLIAAATMTNYGIISAEYVPLTIYLSVASLFGQFGDLAFSSVKRIVKIKDYGKLLPGHGGVLDRFDSTLFAAPFTYIFCSCIKII